LPRLVKKLGTPVYISHLTAPTITWNDATPNIETFQAGTRLSIGDIEIDTFTTPHDAVDPVAFSFRAEGIKIGLVTDLGFIPDSIRFHLRGTHLLILESNHDLEMLKVGPYPWSVKQRVMGRRGHLSNEVVSEFIREDLDTSTSVLVLGHLSEHNNHPELARMAASRALLGREILTRLVIAEPRQRTEVFQF
jgi:phosphoribosyl 1,2-cyclic phosphodiesterase